MLKNKLVGMGVALITPFKENDTIDYDALRRLIEFQIKNGTDYLVVLGTTAETPTLSEEEKEELTHFIITQNRGRLPIVLGIGGNNTRSVVEKIKNTDLSQVDAILSVAPYYNKPSQEGLYQHYKAIAESTNTPIILYNVPGRTGVNMAATTVLRLANEFPNIVAIKEASGNFKQIDDIIKNKPKNFMVISGDDGITFPLITLGAVGVISVIGNAFPKEFSRMVRMAMRGDLEGAREIHYRFTELFELLFVDGNPAGVKSMLSVMGFIENRLRLPLVPTTIKTFEKMRFVLNQLNTKI
ncbi:MAG TPA: 4-hydroxy-tetrahydrodipicolinate synthase [Paludibacteraceae bacterium]|jgi:4-hydroxy-tetrahydrodipicolinate synthase|nr:4-hydroxy-tetrahydrodipicolinate synthase [Paludibacteraceae bacterium]HOO24383.1 4-hydroxy-tetrahydrodipicolinate synthase [Paludibacteraceae bacterium]HOS37937.1 4-hydroxy-tetrahydrodipicolinate synthase [Paludibacteraceae bacterium]HPD27432.1 4-hydroxy-tetrahydrodipicolinate synthase [Paludibacteraceae bacterium]HPK20903.1 4-hydroxy-tetrahydrodipicolinate synthase [Paludibacteraceae bacterium]